MCTRDIESAIRGNDRKTIVALFERKLIVLLAICKYNNLECNTINNDN